MKLQEELIELKACREAVDWVEDKDFETAWNTCQCGDWMLWYVFEKRKELGLEDMRLIIKAKVECVKLIKHLIKDKRSLKALKVAERFGNGKATREELDIADADAAATYAADVAATYAAAANSAYAAANAATVRKENLLKCADICRKVFKDIEFSPKP